jgi:putative phosphoesterase
MERVLGKVESHVNAVVHLGDGWAGIHSLMPAFSHLPLHAVVGNCDFEAGPLVTAFHAGGKKILLTHGHRQHVKTDWQRLSYLAEENEADVCLFGHTHTPAIFYVAHVLLFNPGSISLPRGDNPPTYGVLTITDEGLINACVVGRQRDGSYRPLE